MRNGLFIISLDFELGWCKMGEDYKQNMLGARKVIPLLLDEFTQNNIHATWACVGLLFTGTKGELERYSPEKSDQPTYKNDKLPAYNKGIGVDEESDPLHYAKSLIKQINSTEGQETATHTFSHYYCLAKGQTVGHFEADIKAAAAVAKGLDIQLKSIVFPRNQINVEYLSVLKKYGITSYRGTEPSQIYNANSTQKYDQLDYKGLRLADTYLNITGYETYSMDSLNRTNGVLNIPGSRFFRPYNSNLAFLEKLKLRRIKKSMEYAAMKNQIYHLWWHPHNFGVNIQENLTNLRNILRHYNNLSDKYGMRSVNMNEVTRSKYNETQ